MKEQRLEIRARELRSEVRGRRIVKRNARPSILERVIFRRCCCGDR